MKISMAEVIMFQTEVIFFLMDENTMLYYNLP